MATVTNKETIPQNSPFLTTLYIHRGPCLTKLRTKVSWSLFMAHVVVGLDIYSASFIVYIIFTTFTVL